MLILHIRKSKAATIVTFMQVNIPVVHMVNLRPQVCVCGGGGGGGKMLHKSSLNWICAVGGGSFAPMI